MAVDDRGYTKYHSNYDLGTAGRRRLSMIQQKENTADAYEQFKSQLKSNQAAFDEGIRLRQASLNSLGAASRNYESISQYGSDLLGRVQAAFNPWALGGSLSASQGAGAGMSLGTGGSSRAPKGELGALIKAIGVKESGGSYSAVNRHSGALGKYQIMPANIASWSKAALGYAISPSQFLSSPQYQEQIAQHRLRQYYNQYGSAGAAVAWYAGPGAANAFVRSGYASRGTEANGYPSVYSYLNSIMAEMRRYL